MASAEPADAPATDRSALVVDDLADAVARYVEDLQRAPLATRTREAYAGQVTAYSRWLTGRAAAHDDQRLSAPPAQQAAALTQRHHTGLKHREPAQRFDSGPPAPLTALKRPAHRASAAESHIPSVLHASRVSSGTGGR